MNYPHKPGWKGTATSHAAAREVAGTALESAARTATTQTADIDALGASSILVYLNISAASGTGGLSVGVRGKDPVSGNYASLGTSSTYTTTGIRVFAFGRGVGAYTNMNFVWGGIGVPIPDTLRIEIAHADASSYTYSVGYCLVP